MPFTSTSLASAAGLLAVLPAALAGFAAGSQENIAVYWGAFSSFLFSLLIILIYSQLGLP
jgi:hypothetical protein